MAAIPLLAYQITELTFRNKLPVNTRLHIGTRVSYNVKYAPDGTARGEMSVDVSTDQKENFFVHVTGVGFFRTDGADKTAIHKETFRILFPYLRAVISTVTANAGIPAVILPPMDPEGQNVLKVEINPNGTPEPGKTNESV